MISLHEIENLKYISKDIEFSFWTKLKNRIIARHGRKALFRRFCADNGIDLPLVEGRKYIIPKEYEINHERIIYLGAVRDKAIFAFHEAYEEKKLELDSRIARKKEDIDNRETFIRHKEEVLDKIRANLRKEKDPAAIITYQSQEDLLKTEVENQKQVLDEYNNDMAMLLKIGRDNDDNWKHQITIIEAGIGELMSSFVRNLGKLITDQLDFQDFIYDVPDYSEKVSNIVKGAK